MQEPDWSAVRAEFPVLERWAHLNTAAFGPMPRAAVRAMSEHWVHRDETASSEFLGWFDRLDGLRAKIAKLLNAGPADIGFCPNAGTALSWFLHGMDWRQGDEVLGMEHEFPNNLYAPRMLDRMGVRFRALRAPERAFTPNTVLAALGPRTRAVLISSVNYSNGMRAPLEELGPELRSKGVLLCLDGTQSVGVLRHDLRKAPVDFLFAHGYKWMLAPAGSGFFYASPDMREQLHPTVVSWRSHQTWRDFERLHHGRPELCREAALYEGGVQPFSLLFALEASLDLILECGQGAIERRSLRLARECREALRAAGGEVGGRAGDSCDAPIVTASFPGLDAIQVRERLEKRKVAVAARQGNLRVSLDFFNNRDDIRRLVAALGTG